MAALAEQADRRAVHAQVARERELEEDPHGGSGQLSPACAKRPARAASGARSARSGRSGAGVRCGPRRGRSGQPLDLVDEHRRRRHVEAERTDERRPRRKLRARLRRHVPRRRPRAARCAPRASARPAAARRRPRAGSGSAASPAGRARHSGSSTVRTRPADDRRLDHRARVQPDHGGAVVDRVEVVRLRLRRRWARARRAGRRPTPAARRPAQGPAASGAGGRGRPASREHAAVRAQRGEPAPEELRLGLARPRRAAGVEDVRPTGVEADPRAELLARPRLPDEPVVEALGAGDGDPLRPGCRAASPPPRAAPRSRRRDDPEPAAPATCSSGCPSS